MNKTYTIALVGNPNSGKSTLFNMLTGYQQKVGNWPGVTVEQKKAQCTLEGLSLELIDLPGIYSLIAKDDTLNTDETITQKFLQDTPPDLIINVINAAHLERNLYLTLQLSNLAVPVVLAVNMVDMAKDKGITIETQALQNILGSPTIETVASLKKGMEDLKVAIVQKLKNPQPMIPIVQYPAEFDTSFQELANLIQKDMPTSSQKLQALQILENNGVLSTDLSAPIIDCATKIKNTIPDIDILIADSHYTQAHQLSKSVTKISDQLSQHTTALIDRITLHRFLGLPILFFIMYLMFYLTITVSQRFIEIFEALGGLLFVDLPYAFLSTIHTPEIINNLISNGIGEGIRLTFTFIPVIVLLYFFLSALEDSGYMTRAAFIIDRLMRVAGLSGKAFIPLVLGFGCNVPAIMATQSLNNQNERLITMAVAPFMSCSARLPVYALFALAFFPNSGFNILFFLYITGILIAILTGFILKFSLLPQTPTPFIMELPHYNMPTIRTISIRTYQNLKRFVITAGKIIVPMVFIINTLSDLGSDGTFGHAGTSQSVLAQVSRKITPVFSPMGITEDNWPAVLGIFSGMLAKESVVGSLAAAYKALTPEDHSTNSPSNLMEKITKTLSDIKNMIPLIGDSQEEDDSDGESIIATMQQHFDGRIGAFSYLLFVLLYFPCTAVITAIKTQSDTKWSIFVALWTTFIGYTLATLCYQIGTYTQHPLSSMRIIATVVISFALTFISMKIYGQWTRKKPSS